MDGLEKLKSIGTRKINADTHISVKNLQALFHNSFEDLTRIQVMGFISILEREYKVDLQELRERAKEFFDENEKIGINLLKDDTNVELFVSKKNNYKNSIIIVITLVFVTVLYLVFQSKSDKTPPVEEKKTVKNTDTDIYKDDINKSKDENISEDLNTQTETNISKTHIIKIIPKQKVWFGYIELPDMKKHQKMLDSEFELNASKDYLLSFGHGYIDIGLDDNTTSYQYKRPLRFIYENGELKKITLSKFKEYNKGRVW